MSAVAAFYAALFIDRDAGQQIAGNVMD